MSDTVLVLGATGKTGRRLVPLLTATGADVRSASRHPGGSGVHFDWDRPETHGPALAGADAAFVVMPELIEDPSPVTGPFLDLAREAGVRRVVLLSALGVELSQEQGLLTGFGKVERQLMASGLDWTILRPSGFDQNFSEGFMLPGIMDHDVIAAPTGDGAAPLVDAADIAAVAAVALTEDGHAKAEYAITGPEAITHAEVAEMVSHAAGRPITYQDIPRQTLLDAMVGHGMPADYAEMVVRSLDAIRNGDAATVSDDVERVTGRAATPFADFARRAADAWRTPWRTP
jgi:uncharacterized protein YbjT (DUF2867 family)